MTWWNSRLAGLDVESTGVDVETARIVTAAIVRCGGGQPTNTRTWLVDPGVEIPAEATGVHGVTTERARAEGEDAATAVGSIIEHLAMCVGLSGAPLVVMNARYDLTVLDREARRHGVVPLMERGFPVRVVDPLVIDKWLDRYRKGSRQLDALCEHYGAVMDDGHNAENDALAAARCAYALGSRGRVVRQAWNAAMGREKAALEGEWEEVRGDLARLHAAQVGWAREQAEGLAAYFREKGQTDDAEGVRPEWPCVPARELTRGALL